MSITFQPSLRDDRAILFHYTFLFSLCPRSEPLSLADAWGEVIERDIVERPESVLVLPVGQQNNVILIEEFDLAADTWQLTLPGGKVIDSSPDGIWQHTQIELREEIGFSTGRLERLLDFYSYPGYIAHKVHLLVAYDLGWNPLQMEDGEEIRVHMFTLDDLLARTRIDCRCDPEAAVALWLYKGSIS